ncbi:MAG TPA: formate dehydrogenase accessory protein FdhE [Terriglobales bacterium]|nr:formate dehydrogenase accessory protein FdhE [Terriglobales bacterium]
MVVQAKRASWEARARRAEELAAKYPFAAEVLRFYAGVARFQKTVYEKLCANSALRDGAQRFSLQDLKPALLLPHFPGLLKLIEKSGPAALASRARDLTQGGEQRWKALIVAFQAGEMEVSADSFFVLVLAQPYAEYVLKDASIPESDGRSSCPACGGNPSLAVLRPEGDGGRRSLLCSLCASEWHYLRTKCPACGEENHQSLPVYQAEQFNYIRVDSCDTCHTYLNTIDLTKNGLAIPQVDELAAIPLSLWAEEHGYQKLQKNVMGL